MVVIALLIADYCAASVSIVEYVVNSGRGRPRGGSDARERLVSAGKTVFFERGYADVSVREIARHAGVDHALVNYYFGSKQGLFAEVMALEFSPTSALESVLRSAEVRSPSQLAEEILSAILKVWEVEHTRPGLLNVIESAIADPTTRNIMGEFITAEALTRMRAYIGGADAGRRAAGVSTVISGLIFSRYLLRVEPMASMPPREVVRTLAPMIALHLR